MKCTLFPLVLVLSPLSLRAEQPVDPAPFSLSLHILSPNSDTKQLTGHQTGIGGSWNYQFLGRELGQGCISVGLGLGYRVFQNRTTKHELHGVELGPEVTWYFTQRFQGPYLRFAESLSMQSVTDREGGILQNRQYTRQGQTLALGYRFKKDMSLETLYQNTLVDSDLNLGSWGLAFRVHL